MKYKSKFFNMQDKNNGNISFGKLPKHLHKDTEFINKYFYKTLSNHNKKKTSYHEWYKDLDSKLKQKIDNIVNDKFWSENICKNNKCVLERIYDMDEIYYANPPKSITKDLYGAIGNYGVHSDGMLNFANIKVYRILIGLTNGNDNITYFTDHGFGKQINKNEYLLFDFDKSRHQVLINNDGTPSKYRLVLKLHFLVREKNYSDFYTSMLIKFYSKYLKVTRYVMDKGTNPKTLDEYFYGVLCSIIGTKFNILLSLFVFFIVFFIYKSNQKNTDTKDLLFKTTFVNLIIFILIVFYCYFKSLIINKQ